MAVATMTEKGFAAEVLRHDEPVLVAFRASWCAPSQDLAPLVESVASKYEGRAKVVAVDVEDPLADKLCRRFDVTRLPVVMLFQDGGIKDVIGGATSEEVLHEMLEHRLRPVLHVSERNFERDVLGARLPVLVHFTAAWCDASRELEPIVESMAERYTGRVKVASIDFDENARLCSLYGVFRVPTLALFEDGQIRDRILGAMKGGTKVGGRQTSCVNLTSLDNVSQMVEAYAA